MKDLLYVPVVIVGGLIMTAFLQEQTAVVTGSVQYENGEPLVRGIVEIGDQYDYTDVEGTYRIRNVSFGKQTLVVIAEGDTLREFQLEVDSPRVELDISLP